MNGMPTLMLTLECQWFIGYRKKNSSPARIALKKLLDTIKSFDTNNSHHTRELFNEAAEVNIG